MLVQDQIGVLFGRAGAGAGTGAGAVAAGSAFCVGVLVRDNIMAWQG